MTLVTPYGTEIITFHLQYRCTNTVINSHSPTQYIFKSPKTPKKAFFQKV